MSSNHESGKAAAGDSIALSERGRALGALLAPRAHVRGPRRARCQRAELHPRIFEPGLANLLEP